MEGMIYLADGTLYKGKGFGTSATRVGELVFNTSMTGYQGILTDPSYKGQIINMTYPLIGNYGVSNIDNQSECIHAFGFVTRDISYRPYNRMNKRTILEWLEEQGVPGVYYVDTRSITKKIRAEGTLPCVISTEGIDREEAASLLKKTTLRVDYMKDVGTREVKHTPADGYRIAILDLGIKRNIIDSLQKRGCEIYLFPYGTSPAEILACKPDGFFLSNGPGDPEAATEAVETARVLMQQLPTFGICMGHQLLALATGGSTYKLKFGHRGANHGVYDRVTDKSAITSQNHSFAVDAASVEKKGMIITHINLNDQTVEGMRHRELPVFSVQYHPEGYPGPNDSEGLFDRFMEMIKACKEGTFVPGTDVKGGAAHA
ncbi:MAG: glutamine-hydrolyzing carbamoyl-phosphate synthase small subunit [Clostridiales Family XIII bacterium]|jgi:carbamoyl-phosphate synthase small subunit|nr:glutamine-hydrolyzing carbamoyl-phosphate synthase small subunit [Clostridiales Family XIII bacterium]